MGKHVDDFIAMMQSDFWTYQQLLNFHPINERFWLASKEQIRSADWLNNALASISTEEFHALLKELKLDQRAYSAADPDRVRYRAAVLLSRLLAPTTKRGKKVAQNIDSMACQHFNLKVLKLLQLPRAEVRIDGTYYSLPALFLRRARLPGTFELVDRRSLTVVASGDYDAVSNVFGHCRVRPEIGMDDHHA